VTRTAASRPQQHDHSGHDDRNADPARRVTLGGFAAEMSVLRAIRFISTGVPPANPVETGGP
jgi:hypothetical protein